MKGVTPGILKGRRAVELAAAAPESPLSASQPVLHHVLVCDVEPCETFAPIAAIVIPALTEIVTDHSPSKEVPSTDAPVTGTQPFIKRPRFAANKTPRAQERQVEPATSAAPTGTDILAAHTSTAVAQQTKRCTAPGLVHPPALVGSKFLWS